jgi:cbb3-type cytochrome oxidase subunit 3
MPLVCSNVVEVHMQDFEGRPGRPDMRERFETTRTKIRDARQKPHFWRYFFGLLMMAVVVVAGIYWFFPSSRPAMDAARDRTIDRTIELKDQAVEKFRDATGNGTEPVQPKPPVGPAEPK